MLTITKISPSSIFSFLKGKIDKKIALIKEQRETAILTVEQMRQGLWQAQVSIIENSCIHGCYWLTKDDRKLNVHNGYSRLTDGTNKYVQSIDKDIFGMFKAYVWFFGARSLYRLATKESKRLKKGMPESNNKLVYVKYHN